MVEDFVHSHIHPQFGGQKSLVQSQYQSEAFDEHDSSTRTLFIRNLNRNSSVEEVFQALKKFGSIADTDPRHLNSEGFVLVTYHDLRDSQFAFRQIKFLPLLYPNICQPNMTPGVHFFVHMPLELYSQNKNEGILLIESIPSSSFKLNEFKLSLTRFGDIRRVFSPDQLNSMIIVEFFDLRSAELAQSYLHEQVLMGNRLYVSFINGNTSWEIAGYGNSKNHKGCTPLANALSSCQPFMYMASPFTSPKSSPPSSPVISPTLSPPMTSPSSSNSSPSTSRSSSPIPQLISADRPAQNVANNNQISNLHSEDPHSLGHGTQIMQNSSNYHIQNPNPTSHSHPTGHSRMVNERFQINLENIAKGLDKRTTLMIRNIPNKYTQDMLLEFLDQEFKGLYDFIYLPIDFKNKCNVGYSFINFINPTSIIPFTKVVHGKKWTRFNSEKICQLTYARIQGKESLIRHFQNSTIMSEDKTYQPKIFHSSGQFIGQEMKFPDPLPEHQDCQRHKRILLPSYIYSNE